MWLRNKNSLVLSVILSIALVLSACGNPSEKSSGSVPVPSPQQTATKEPVTRIYKDDTGKEVEIPTHPRKVVASYYVGHLLSLGVKPVGTASQFFLDSSYLKDKLAGIEPIGDNGSYNIEKILSLAPDLIIVNEFVKPEEVEKLSKVAPTVTIKYAGNDMFVHLNKLADILGKSAEAKQWVDQYQAKAAKIKSQLTANGKQAETATVLQFMNKQVFAYFENISITIYQTLGFKVPQKVKDMNPDNKTGFAKVSMEVVPDYAADRMFVIKPYDTLTDALYKDVLESTLWKSLPAALNKHVYILDNKWNGNDPISMDAQLDDIVKLLLN
ncbi:ABC transporter substrate-binding protein [Paenibacillus oryzisoli]|uniref:Fe/B12 periplasmic-binding domain-containing protein n=1 Tax=Paenibacillus oryzisoli TaxID=1850517 RepID=A0A198AI24_9BACL|nr:ABC transporter substrate-binding protein [Paenibacillus oryzisoli]OAS20720.1 hypothetical protein A8708_19495 [Paenibacillus oryzisoli]